MNTTIFVIFSFGLVWSSYSLLRAEEVKIPTLLTEGELMGLEAMAHSAEVPLHIVRDFTPAEEKEQVGLLLRFDKTPVLTQQTDKVLAEEKVRDDETQRITKQYLENIGMKDYVMPSTPVSLNADNVVKDSEKEFDAQKATSMANEEAPMVITSKDGLYFDAESGLLVYLRDIVVTDPRFNMTCDNQLKVYLERSPEKTVDKKKEKKPEQKTEETSVKKNDDESALKVPEAKNMNFSGIKRLAASGKVIITRRDEQGKLMCAKAETATYDGKTGEIILSGSGVKSLQEGDNLVETSGNGSYIRIYGNGSVYIKGKQVVTKLKNEKGAKSPLSSKKQ